MIAAPDHDPARAGESAPAAAHPAAAPDAEAGTSATASVDVAALLAALLDEMPLSRAVKVAERATGLPHRALYRLALDSAQRRERP